MPGPATPHRRRPAPPRLPAVLLGALLACGALLPAGPAGAQLNQVQYKIDRGGGYIGIAGVVRPGHWTPMRVTLANLSTELREVGVQWLLEDEDGDRVIAQRRATLNPGRADIHVWLYAPPDMSTNARNLRWTVQVVDAETGKGLGEPIVVTTFADDPTLQLLPPHINSIAIMGSLTLGLDDMAAGTTSHEVTALATGLNLTKLPDRWYGLSAFNTLIWTDRGGEGGSPTDAGYTFDQQEALRQWVRRGGHLVIVLPAYNQPWTGSKLADILPVTDTQMRRVTDIPPESAGTVISAERAPVTMTVFDLPAHSTAEVIERDRRGNAVVVAKRYGFGRVTLMGLDIADPTIVNMGLPNGKWNLWHKVFNWHAPAIAQAQIKGQVERNDLLRPDLRHANPERIGPDWLPGIIDMTGTATPALLLAILIFIVYWLAAGPGLYGLLRAKGLHRHTWVVFVLVVGVFTGVTWAGALLFRQGQTTVAHFSVLDIDGNTGQVHARGWLSLFVPQFGTANIAIDPDHPEAHNTLASPGVVSQLDAGRFPDQQAYTVDAGSPTAADIPVRATAKRFTYDYSGRLDDNRKGLREKWFGIEGTIALEQGWPKATLNHGLPEALAQVLIVYCPGDGQTPWVWRHQGQWAPGVPITIEQPNQALRLVVPRLAYTDNRQYPTEGFLGSLIVGKTAAGAANQHLLPGGAGMNRKQMQQIEMLSFFDAMPPPNFRKTDAAFGMGGTETHHRLFGRELDLTPLIDGKRLILIGYLKGPYLPVPLTVDGRPVEKVSDNAWTVVRWVYDFE